MDYSDVKKVVETTNVNHVNAYLATDRWAILETAGGVDENGAPVILYALGWYGNYSETVDTEFPKLPE